MKVGNDNKYIVIGEQHMSLSFKQFLIESGPSMSKHDMEVIWNTIQKDCQPYLQELEGTPETFMLYRGMRKNDPVTIETTRKDRKPVDSDPRLHNLADEWFNSKFGFKARSQAVFASPSVGMTKRYGTVYAIFPIGDFQYVWSPKVNDFYQSTLHLTNKSDEEVIEFMDGANYTNSNIGQMVNRGKAEVMIFCDKYYAVREDVYDDIEHYIGSFKGGTTT
jgi:hypothetical protein